MQDQSQPQRQSPSGQFFKTDGGKTKSNEIEIPSISLPKGGGAIKGIDEKFSVNAVNGTASISLPLPFSPARGGSPSLSVSYNSGSGNGIFGLGWNLDLPSIKRKTDKGLPQYHDSVDSDTFLFSGVEDLVPEFKRNPDGSFLLDHAGDYVFNETKSADGLFVIRRYRPRIEGLFARIEQWKATRSDEIKWRVITRENKTTLFGWSMSSRISDPKDESKIYEWLPEFSFDDKGNCSEYIYKRDDSRGLDTSLLHNRNRLSDGKITYTNLYLKKVIYGNKTPYKKFGDPFPPETDYFFSTEFDYGEYDQDASFSPQKVWDFRFDAFSDYKAGFEIRTTRLCKRVLLFHHFTNANEYEGLVKSLNFEYDTISQLDFTFLKAITMFGYIKKEDGTYTHKNFPSLEFDYQKHDWNRQVKTISTEDLANAPSGLDEPDYQLTDLFGEGLSGILTEQAGGWYYKHNLSNGKFGQARLVTPKPSFAGLGKKLQLADLEADGRKQLVQIGFEPRGFFELDDGDQWQLFRNFLNIPTVDFNDPNTRMLDLNGDGKPDLLISEDNVFTWYPSEGKHGYSREQRISRPFDEEDGPQVIFANRNQIIFLADMSGDGLTDIVRIRNGEVCYWPNLGFGKFGAKVAMDHSPVFDYADSFNSTYLRLADIDGSGTTDIIYLSKTKFTCWTNLNGNSFTDRPFEINHFPEINSHSNITVADLLGNGVACIVWSSSLPNDNNSSIKYIDLMNSKKPHILVSYKNNLGKEVRLEYTPSTKFYIDDKLAGKSWVTRLHFPVHCISKTETLDRVSGSRFTTTYKYHHGYYDHTEREFRGFGMIEQMDSEDFEHWVKGNASNIVERELHQEPVVSKLWFHTGAFLDRERIVNQFADDYWYEEMKRQGMPVVHREETLPEAGLIADLEVNKNLVNQLSVQEWREVLRACKGMKLRSEVFAKDAAKNGNTPNAKKMELTPFNVATQNCTIELLQPRGKNKYAVFLVKESETIAYNYERNPEDPRVVHSLNILFDKYGNIKESASVVYPRFINDSSLPDITQAEQNKTVIIYTQNHFTNDIVETALLPDVHRLPLASETKTYELKGVAKAKSYYSLIDFTNILDDAKSDTAFYHELNKPLLFGKAQKRLIEHIRSTYYNNTLTSALPLYQLESLALPYERYQLAYTPELLKDIFGTKVKAETLIEGKFTHYDGDNNWWIRSGTIQFKTSTESVIDSQNRFYSPLSYTDPYGAITKVKYYGSYFLFIEETEDTLGNKVSVDLFNFRTLSPRRMKDINGNFSEAISDELGLVKAVAMMGKGNEADDLTGFAEITDTMESIAIMNFFKAPDSIQLISGGKALLNHASSRFVYDFDEYRKVDDENKLHVNNGNPQKIKPLPPVVMASITRETHYKKPDGTLNPESKVQIAFEYSNGLGEVVMKKVQAEPGIAKKVVVNPDNSILVTEINTECLNPKHLRWIGTGRVVKNNKGNIIKQYEPYFSINWYYEDYKELVETGITSKLFYDAVGRLIKTEMPDCTFSKIEFDSWKKTIYDANDTILDSSWYIYRVNRLIDAQLLEKGKDPAREKLAALKAARHANTPNVLHFDTLGRPVLSIEHNKIITTDADEFYFTRVLIDTEGNLRSVTDNKGNIVMQYKYSMLGTQIYQNGMDSGKRWLLTNILSKPLRAWDERNHEFQYFYDAAHRPTYNKAIGGDGDTPLDNVINRIIYGESLLTGIRTDINRFNEASLQVKNILGQIIQNYDTAGLLDTPDYDFKGQPIATTRKLFRKYKEVCNWIDANLIFDLEQDKGYTFTTFTDALNRITQQTTPDGSIITPIYNEAGLLDGESVLHPSITNPSVYIKDIEYNEKGQRNKIIYGNDSITNYYYDEETFRIKRLESKRLNGDPLHDWNYTYDPVGNITHIEDKNIPVVFFDNQKIAGVSSYAYDALYRLVQASGRENNAALNFGDCDNWHDKPFMHYMDIGAFFALRNYTQYYQYDAVGNITQIKHVAPGGNWTRGYEYEVTNNRLKQTFVGDITNSVNYFKYSHHAKHGYMEKMPHLEKIGWNFKEEIILTSRQHCTDENLPEITYYQYDSSGQRIRKITEKHAGAGATPTKKEERVYLAEYELYKKHSGTNAGLERVTISLIDEGHSFLIIETRNDVDDGTEKKLVRYQLRNHLGSSSLELDDTARVISYEEYHPYGTTSYQAKNAAIKCAAKRYRFSGMERDDETGLEYHGARYYLPWLGRWSSCDPAGLVDGNNLYRYSQNCPVLLTDPFGTDPPDPRNFSTFEEFSWAADAPYSIEYLQELWQKSHKDSPTKIPVNGSVSDEDKTQLAAAGVYFMPDNSADIGTPVHLLVLPILSARLASHGIPSLVETPTLFGGSKKGRSEGFIDLTVLVPPESSANISEIEAHIYDLKPGGSSSGLGHIQQVERYQKYYNRSTIPGVDIVSPQVGTVLYEIAAKHPDVLEPIDVPGTMGRVYIGLQLTAPGIIEYHLGVRPIPVPVRREVEVEVRQRAPVRETVRTAAKVGFWATIGIGIWEGAKWTAAVLAAPETGGASLAGAAALP